MNVSKSNYKTRNLALGTSLAFHCLLILFAVIYSYIYVRQAVVFESPPEKTIERRATPAPVKVLQRSRTASPQAPQKLKEELKPRLAETTQVRQAVSMPQQIPKPKIQEQQKQALQQKKKEEKQQATAQAIPKSLSVQAPGQRVFPVARSTGYTNMPRPQSSTVSRRASRRRSGSERRGKITPAQFMQAFRNAYRGEQESQARRDQYAAPDGDRYAAVQQQLNEFKYANYNTKVNQVLENSFSIYSSPIYFDRDIYQQINVSLLIGPQGEVIEVKLVEPTGYEPLDNHILSVIKKSRFAPIPKHLNCDRYAFSLAPWVDVKKGTGIVAYRYIR